jgi:hypothetical protein
VADWYLSSVAYDAVTQWAASTTYAVGDIRRQLAAPTYPNHRCFRVSSITTGISGGSEPAWNLGLAATTTDGGVTWTECTGNSARQQNGGVTNTWTAPARHFENLDSAGNNGPVAGDRIFASSDHNETITTTAHTLNTAGSTTSPLICVSVDRTTGNIPPLAADITAGAKVTCSANSGSLFLGNNPAYYDGFTFEVSGTGNCFIQFVNSAAGPRTFKNCKFIISGTGSGSQIIPTNNAAASIYWQDCTVKFGAVGQGIAFATFSDFVWRGGSVDAAGSNPTILFQDGNSGAGKGKLIINGVDLSFVSGTILGGISFSEASFKNCKIHASATLAVVTNGGYGGSNTIVEPRSTRIEFLNCHNSNNYTNAWLWSTGGVFTETTITRTGGASDGTQKHSDKMVSATSGTRLDKFMPLELHLYQWNELTGSPKTATVEFISSATLKNDEIWGELEYLGDSGDPKSLFVDDQPATILTANANQTSSTATWDSSPATPVTQKLSLTFTAQKKGLLHFVVRLAKLSTTVYVDPLIVVT